MFAGACAIGPAVLVPDDWEAPLEIRMRILGADGAELFAGETSTAQMRRSFPELVEWLLRDNPVPPGSVLLTGTGLVPPDDFTLEPGHTVEITVPEIGTLSNPVGRRGRPDHSEKERDPCLRSSRRRRARRSRTSSAASGGRARPARPTRSAAPGARPRRSASSPPRARRTSTPPSRPPPPRSPSGRAARARSAPRSCTAAADAIERRVEQIAQDMTLEMGKPLREARMESARRRAILRFFAGEAWRPKGELYEQSATGGAVYTIRRPLGVVGLITPWNFPAAIPPGSRRPR